MASNFNLRSRKALSPIITTILLILLAIVLATIVLLWARGFVKEPVSKFSPAVGEDRPIEEVCEQAGVQGTRVGSEIQVTNIQSVPIYKLGIRVSGAGDSSIKYAEVNLTAGSSVNVNPGLGDLSTASKIEIIPVLLGIGEEGGYKEYNCLQDTYIVE